MSEQGDPQGEATEANGSPDLASEVSAWAERLAEKVQAAPETDDAEAAPAEPEPAESDLTPVDAIETEAVEDEALDEPAEVSVPEDGAPEAEAAEDETPEAEAAEEPAEADLAAVDAVEPEDVDESVEVAALEEEAPEEEADEAGLTPADAETETVAEDEAPEAEAAEEEAAEAEAAESDDEPTPDIASAIEAVLMVVDEPVPTVQFAQVLETPRVEVEETLRRLAAEYTEQGRGFDLREVAGGWRFYSRSECAPVVERFILDGQQARLTQAALETLAVVAYRQPVSRARVAAIRGVNCDGVVRTLVSRGLIEEAGHEEESNALLYRTTSLFLERLGLQSVDDLPDIAPYLPEVDDVNDVEDLAG